MSPIDTQVYFVFSLDSEQSVEVGMTLSDPLQFS